MDKFDKQRIENAIWILEHYKEEIVKKLIELDYLEWEARHIIPMLHEAREHFKIEEFVDENWRYSCKHT